MNQSGRANQKDFCPSTETTENALKPGIMQINRVTVKMRKLLLFRNYSTMNKHVYFPPESEIIDLRQEEAFLIDSLTGRADNQYDTNVMEEL